MAFNGEDTITPGLYYNVLLYTLYSTQLTTQKHIRTKKKHATTANSYQIAVVDSSQDLQLEVTLCYQVLRGLFFTSLAVVPFL